MIYLILPLNRKNSTIIASQNNGEGQEWGGCCKIFWKNLAGGTLIRDPRVGVG